MLNLGVKFLLLISIVIEINDKYIQISTGFNKISRSAYSTGIFNMIFKTMNVQDLLLLQE